MRYSRLVRLIARLFLLILASTMSLVSFLGGYSALLILGDEDNIDLDVDFSTGNLLEDPLNFNPDEFKIQVEFEINNQGYFDLEDLRIEMELWIIYHEDPPGGGDSGPVPIRIYEDHKSFSTIEAGEKEKNKITIDYDDLKVINWTHIAYNIDPDKDIYFKAYNIDISAKYSLGLIAFKIKIDEMDLGDYKITT